MYCAFVGWVCGNLIHLVVYTFYRSAAVMSVCVTLCITEEEFHSGTYRRSWCVIRSDVMANWAVDVGSKVGNTSGANITSVTKQHVHAQGRRTLLCIAVTISTGDSGYRRRIVTSLELYPSSQPRKPYVQFKQLSAPRSCCFAVRTRHVGFAGGKLRLG